MTPAGKGVRFYLIELCKHTLKLFKFAGLLLWSCLKGIWQYVLVSKWWNYTFAFVVLPLFAALPFAWLLSPEMPQIFPSLALPSKDLFTRLALCVGWLILLISHLLFWLIYLPSGKMKESIDPKKLNANSAKSSEAPEGQNQIVPKPVDKTPSKQAEDLLRRFNVCVKGMGAARFQFEITALEKSLRNDADPSLRLVFKLDKPDAHAAVVQLTEDGRLICKDVDKLRLAQPIALKYELSLDVGGENNLDSNDVQYLKTRAVQKVEVVIRLQLAEAETAFLAWAINAAKSARMPNAKQGVPYSLLLGQVLPMNSEFVNLVSVNTGVSGLTWRLDTGCLEGEPAVGNNHQIIVTAACSRTPSLVREIPLLLTCTMDPEVEWRRIQQVKGDEDAKVEGDMVDILERAASSIRNAEGEHPLVPHPLSNFGKPHRVRYSRQFGELHLNYASVRGRSHIQDDKFREDHAGTIAFHENRALAVVVSDGAGSASLSRRGSEIVVNVALVGMRDIGKEILENLELVTSNDNTWLHEKFTSLVQLIRERIEFESEQVRSAWPSFADKGMYATFLGSLILPCPEGHLVLSYSVGDGAIGIGLAPAGDVGLKSVPDHGESAGQTLFVLSKGADDSSKRLRVDRIAGDFTLMLMTDGVTDPLISGEDIVTAERWNSLATELSGLGEEPATDGEAVATRPFSPLVEWLESYHKSHHDDRTIACVTRKTS